MYESHIHHTNNKYLDIVGRDLGTLTCIKIWDLRILTNAFQYTIYRYTHACFKHIIDKELSQEATSNERKVKKSSIYYNQMKLRPETAWTNSYCRYENVHNILVHTLFILIITA